MFSLIMFCGFACIYPQTNSDPALKLPQKIDEWTTSAERTFNNSTLYDYIDGAAELYLSFGFSKVYNRIYSRPGYADILVDIFYMNSSYDSFGVFSFSVGKVGNDFGIQSQIATGAKVFWKSNYYVSITCYPETGESNIASTKLARLIDESITGKSELPEILNYLPSESLDKESMRYFRHYVWLNSHVFISNENILNIDQKTQAVLAKYGEKEKSVLLIVKYPSGAEAAAAKEKFIKNYNPELLDTSAVITKNGKWCGIETIENFFVGVFNASQKDEVNKLLVLSKKKINNAATSK